MDTVTYPHKDVASSLNEHFAGARLELSSAQPLAQRFNVTWTPALLFLDEGEVLHYRTYGFHPPEEFRPMMGVARGMADLNRGKYPEAVATFARVVEEGSKTSFHPEALYWLGVSHYRNGNKESLLKAWNLLMDRHPESLWAKKAGFVRG